MLKNATALAISLFAISLVTISKAQKTEQPYTQRNGEVHIPLLNAPGGTKMIRLQPRSAQIIRVTSSPDTAIANDVSLMVSTTAKPVVKYRVDFSNGEVILNTDSVRVVVSALTGNVAFYDKAGKILVKQHDKFLAPTFTSATYDGENTYRLTQYFDSQPDEAYYGLGQHQQGIVNYKGRRIDLTQNNTEVAVPFVVSNKRYGILWDNYSISTAGDIRALQPLNVLKLYSKDGQQGWITATYTLKNAPGKVYTAAISDLDYNWLSDMKKFPDSVKMADATVNYEGAIEGSQTGLYQLHLKYAGYVKLWVDGKMLLDNWRQPWNPATAIVDLNQEKGKKYEIKLQWKPGGNESYLGAGVLTPAPTQVKNTFAFTSEAGNTIDYYFIYGHTADAIISSYRSITGKAVMLPRWAMGFWQSRERYKTQDDILNVVKEFRTRKIPIDNIVLDWSYWKQDEWGSQEFDAARFAAPDGMIKHLHAQNINFMISVWPKFYEGIEAYNDFNRNNYLYKRNIAKRQRDWIGKGYVSTFYDAFNPDARKAFWGLMNKKLFTKGIDAWWLDATEPDILSNADVAHRKTLMTPTYLGSATKYFNAFPLQNAKGVYEGQRLAAPSQRVFILTRSAYAGLQRYAAATWSGDIASRWEDMKAQIGAGINFSLSGMPYWTMDIGGFAVEQRFEKPKPDDQAEWREMMTRWFQFGAFVPLFRSHGQFPFREVYNIAPADHPAYKSMLYYNKLRYRLMPYIYSLAGQTFHNDYTLMRGLIMDFPDDKMVTSVNDQYMFGPALLINPVTKYGASQREVYLPHGKGWYDLYSGRFFEGGKKIEANAPYERMPVFVKAGSIIPTGVDIQYTNQKPKEPITLYVFTGANASFTLYDDEGTNYNYENGKFSQTELTYNEVKRTLTIGNTKGSFKGMVNKRTLRIVVISAQKPLAFDGSAKPAKEVVYTGKQVVVQL